MTQSLLLTLFFFEAGIFFLVTPWTRFWLTNPLLHWHPTISMIVSNGFFRGFVAGFGLIHLLVAFREMGKLVGHGRGLS